MIIWIMGLNGAGKSSVAKELSKILNKRKIANIILDGNHLREIFEQNGYDRASRIALGIRYAELAKTLASQSSKAVIIAANGMLEEACAYNRLHLSEYYEVFLDVPKSVLERRDSAGIYSKFKAGLVRNVGGLDLEVDIPQAHLHISYNETLTPYDIACQIDSFLCESKAQNATQSNAQKPTTSHSIESNILDTKAKTLQNLSSKLQYAKILPLWIISKKDFLDNSAFATFLQELDSTPFSSFIVRSSAKSEDSLSSSNAGAYASFLYIKKDELKEYIFEVFASYHKEIDDKLEAFSRVDENEVVLLQPMAEGVVCSGVAFNRQPKSNAPYYVIEYSLESTHAITSGEANTQTFYIAHCTKEIENPYLQKIIKLLQEIESFIPNTPLDVEFGITQEAIYCFQVRPLLLKTLKDYPSHSVQLALLKNKIHSILKPHPSLYGTQGMLGIMPDWNPAEIIGLHPHPLAFSLYANLITDSVYATQRAEYGYKDVSANPLIYNLHGKPYVDVRASFNSFLPRDLSDDTSQMLTNYYLQRLRENPHWHDKVEFEILFDSYYFDTPKRLQILSEYGFGVSQIDEIGDKFKALTNTIIANKIYIADIQKLEILSRKREQILSFESSLLEKIYWLLQDCRNYGTKPFVGLARIGFMAMGFLNALVKENILDEQQKQNFIQSLECITSHFATDLHNLSKNDFLRKYGHLRPGTYDILSPRYDEGFDFYFKHKAPLHLHKDSFNLSLEQIKAIDKLLKEHKIQTDVLGFFDFISTGIIYREQSKFEFSKNLSTALSLIAKLGAEFGLSSEDMSYCDVDIFFKAYRTSNNLERLILESIEYGKSSYELQQAIILPPLIAADSQVECFSIAESMPNFITQKRIEGQVLHLKDNTKEDLAQKIVCISRADPGFDWIFSHNIKGLITEFGGANSHMAIRANELGIPAVIGCGEKFATFAGARALEIDCSNSKVVVL